MAPLSITGLVDAGMTIESTERSAHMTPTRELVKLALVEQGERGEQQRSTTRDQQKELKGILKRISSKLNDFLIFDHEEVLELNSSSGDASNALSSLLSKLKSVNCDFEELVTSTDRFIQKNRSRQVF